MTPAQIDLLHQYLDDRLPECEIETLRALLRESGEARRLLRSLAAIDASLTELAEASLEPTHPVRPAHAIEKRTAALQWRTLGGLALGLLIGIISSTVAFAYAAPQWLVGPRAQQTVLAEGFESTVAPGVGGLPSGPGAWSGDFAAIAGPQDGIVPSGAKMLQFLRADYEGKANADESYCGDLFRLVDVRPFRQQLATGKALLEVSAAFNAAPFPESERYRCSLAMHALTADLVANPAVLSGAMLSNNSLAMARQSCPQMDRDPHTWQRVEGEMQLPAETEFVLIHIGMNHIPKFQRRVTFDGHYLDDVKITLTQRR